MRRYEITIPNEMLRPFTGTNAFTWHQSSEVKFRITKYWGNATDIGTPGRRIVALLPVQLSSFRTEYTNAGVVLKWTTESEIDNAGFYIIRSETKEGEFVVVNPTIIQGAGTSGERNNYTWKDTTAKPNTVYYYRIEDVSHAGVREQLATVRLRGLVTASGKLTTRWADLKMQE